MRSSRATFEDGRYHLIIHPATARTQDVRASGSQTLLRASLRRIRTASARWGSAGRRRTAEDSEDDQDGSQTVPDYHHRSCKWFLHNISQLYELVHDHGNG